jgi:simple sugar transport system permease protein
MGAFGDRFSLAGTLQWTTILLFTGLSFAIAFKAGLFNIGAQGQFVLGSLATTVTVLWLGPHAPGGVLGGLVLVPAGLVSGTLVGAAYGWLPGYLKYRFETNEVISTLLLNFIASAVAFVLVDRYFGDESIQGTVTERIPEAATFRPRLGYFPEGTDFSEPVFLFALVVVAGFYWLLGQTTVGYDIRAMGTQPKAAVFGGVSKRFTTLFSFTLAGAVAGLGGAVFVMMVLGRWQTGAPPIGFDGIAVSILAGNNPVGLLPSGLLFGALETGSREIEFQLGIPGELVEVLRGLIILLVATPELFRMLGKRLDRRGTIDLERGGEK